ncbi:MAG: sigma-70 family RNA polymerase sigma factor [Calditrichaeota bacterium]|nr:MAG: sigma-70 family RNA polymerase sigma factor [Calditrichota bacterium]
MDLSRISHNELIELITRECKNEKAWREFIRRYNTFIASVVLRQCKYLNYSAGENQLEDLIHQVYLKLLEDNCKALKVFKRQYENAIFKYLRTIAIRVVLIEFAKSRALKRSPRGGTASLDRYGWDMHHNHLLDLTHFIPDSNWDKNIKRQELAEEINLCLDKILEQNRNANRNKLIFRYYLFAGFEVREIASLPQITLSEKRISNLITDLKEKIRLCLKSRNIFS